MRPTRTFSAASVALLVLLGGCGSETGGDARAADPGGASTGMPTAVPASHGEVRGAGTVMDTGRPELCLGPVAESWPPQCRGIPLVGWRWDDRESGSFDRSGDIRWGEYVVTGSFDGTTLTVTSARPSRADPAPPPEHPPASRLDEGRLAEIQGRVGALPGMLTSWVADGRVHVDVVHDDGSLQDTVDAAYGAGVVVVWSALRPAG